MIFANNEFSPEKIGKFKSRKLIVLEVLQTKRFRITLKKNYYLQITKRFACFNNFDNLVNWPTFNKSLTKNPTIAFLHNVLIVNINIW